MRRLRSRRRDEFNRLLRGARRAWGSGVGLRGDLHVLGEVVGYVLLALVAEEGDDRLELGVGLAHLAGGDQVRPARRPHEEAVSPGQLLHALDRLAGVHGEGGVHEPLVALEDAGHEAVGDPLYEVLPHLAAQDGRRLRGLHREELDPRVDLAEGLSHAYQGAARAYPHDERVGDGALGELGEYLRPQPHAVLLDVPLRLELRGAEVAVLPPELLGLGQRLVDVEVADLQDLGAEGAAYGDPLARHPLRHHDEHAVALHGGDHGEGVAGVARRCLDYCVALGEEALPLGALYHVLGDARLYGAGGVEVLELAVDAFDLEHRRIAYGVEDALRDAPVARSVCLHRDLLLFRCNVCPGEAAVNQEGGGRDVRGLVRGEEEGAVGDLGSLREPAHRQVDEPSLGLLRVLGEELLQERRVHGARAQRVCPHPLPGELHAELAAHGEHTALGGGVGDLGGRGPHHRDEGSRVDDRATAALQEVRDAVLAAEVDRLQVHVLDPLPGVQLRLQDRVVVRRGDAGVVEQDVDPAEAPGGLPVHGLHVFGVGDVGVDVEAVYLRGGLPARLVREVGYADARALLGEAPRGLAPDAARGPGYDGDLAFETARHIRTPPWRCRRSSPRCSSRGRAGRARARRRTASSRRRAWRRGPRCWSLWRGRRSLCGGRP